MNISEAQKAIDSTIPDSDIRDNRGMSNGEAVRQGDVYVIKAASREQFYEIANEMSNSMTSKERGQLTNNTQIAPGSTKGSRHIVEGNVQIFSPAEGADTLEGPEIVATDDWRLCHPEHSDHVFGHGNYFTLYQRDFAKEERERVRD